jgi:hypothetical protein
LFTSLLVIAPLNYGSTRAGGPELIAGGCAAAAALWLLSLVLGGAAPVLPAWTLVGSALVLLAALPWFAGIFQPTSVLPFTAAHFSRIVNRWPHSIVWITPANSLRLTVALALAILPLIDLARSRAWALAFSIALAGTATVIGGLALAQNYTHAPGIYWQSDPTVPTHFAGTFYHHTSAGAYFNTAWPLAVALAVLAARRAENGFATAALIGAAALGAVLILAAHGSHISRFPQVAALLVMPFLLRGLHFRRRSIGLLTLGAVAAIIALIAIAGRGRDIMERWQLLAAEPRGAVRGAIPDPSTWSALMRADLFVPSVAEPGMFGDRLEGWRTALRAIAARPFTGHGPADWMGAASHHSVDPFVRTFFQFLQFAHQDLLQSVVEWGLVGAAGWWLLLLGGVGTVARARVWVSSDHRALGIGAACGLAAVLLQAQLDFPLQIPAVAFNALVLAALGWAAVARPRPAQSALTSPPPPAA